MVEKIEVYREKINNLWREYDWKGNISIDELNSEIDSILYQIQEETLDGTNNNETNATLSTYTGLIINLANPEEFQIDIIDIAHALAKEQRFANHLKAEYSVADHCIACCNIMLERAPKLALEALMHDATEAYLRDMPRPIKRIMPQYKILEERLESVIAKKYKLKYPFPIKIKEVDMMMYEIEDYKFRLGKKADSIKSYGVEGGKNEFLKLFDKLKREVEPDYDLKTRES